MKDCLYSNESAEGFDDFSYSLFAFLDVFAILDMADGRESGCRTNQFCHTLPGLRFAGAQGG